MSAMTNGIGWFEIGTDDAAAAEGFYGELFGWSFANDENSPVPYRVVTAPAGKSIKGGILDHGGKISNYTIWCVVVADVAETARLAEKAGGKVLVPPTGDEGGVVFAHLADPAGNRIGVYSPPPGSDT